MVLKDNIDVEHIDKGLSWWKKNKGKIWTVVSVVVALVAGNSAPSAIDAVMPDDPHKVQADSQDVLDAIKELEEKIKKWGDKETNGVYIKPVQSPRSPNCVCEVCSCNLKLDGSPGCDCGEHKPTNRIPIK